MEVCNEKNKQNTGTPKLLMPWKALTIPHTFRVWFCYHSEKGVWDHTQHLSGTPRGYSFRIKVNHIFLNPHPFLQSHREATLDISKTGEEKKKKHSCEMAIDQPSYRFTTKNKYLAKARKPTFHHVLKIRSALWHLKVAKTKPLCVNSVTKIFQGNF